MILNINISSSSELQYMQCDLLPPSQHFYADAIMIRILRSTYYYYCIWLCCTL